MANHLAKHMPGTPSSSQAPIMLPPPLNSPIVCAASPAVARGLTRGYEDSQPYSARLTDSPTSLTPAAVSLGIGASKDSLLARNGAAVRSQPSVESMLSRLQTLTTFQPILTTGTAYAPAQQSSPSGSHQSDILSGTARAAPAAKLPDPWAAIDNALDAAPTAMLNHNYGDHFAATMAGLTARTPGHGNAEQSGRSTKLIIEVFHVAQPRPSADVLAASARAMLESLPTAEPAVDTRTMFLAAWIRDHPGCTPEEIREQTELWTMVRAETDRTARQRHVDQMRRELHVLVEQQRAADAAGAAPADRDPGLTDPEAGAGQDLGWDAREEQRHLWELFSAADPACMAPASLSAELVSAPRSTGTFDDDVHLSGGTPVAAPFCGGYPGMTHRHDDAAVRIQCAFRRYIARGCTDWRRAARRRIFEETLRAEEVARQQWEVAVRISSTQSGNTEEAERTLRALQHFSNRVIAAAEVRRARRRLAEAERAAVEAYAATAIQSVFRGFWGRKRAMYIRHPDLWEAKLLRDYTVSAVVVQRIWRGHATRKIVASRVRAAAVIQRAYRSHTARVRARAIRRQRRLADVTEVRRYAGQTVGRLCMRLIRDRRAQRAQVPRLAAATGPAAHEDSQAGAEALKDEGEVQHPDNDGDEERAESATDVYTSDLPLHLCS